MRKPMAMPELLTALLTASGPSGHEEEPARVWREAAAAFAEVTSDTLGSSFARVRAGDGAPTLAIVGHIDEIGIAVTNIEENGLLSFTTIGGIAAETLHGQRVELLTRNGRVPGASRASGSSRSRCATVRGSSSPTCTSTSARRAARRRRASFASATRACGRGRRSSCRTTACSRSRSTTGSARTSRSSRRVGSPRRGDAQVDVVAVAAVQEEIGLYGARAAAFALEPHVAIVVDVTPATDYPGGDVAPGRPHRARDGRDDRPRPDAEQARHRPARRGRRGRGHPARVRDLLAQHLDRRRRDPSRARGRSDRPALDPDALPAQPERDLRPRRRRGDHPADRRVRAAPDADQSFVR